MLRQCPVLDYRFRVFNVDVAEVIVPILVGNSCCLGELASRESSVDFCGCGIKLVENPEFSQGFVTTFHGISLELEGVNFAYDVFGCLIDFVAELAVPVYLSHIESNVAT